MIKSAGDVRPSSHVQALRDPFQAYRRFQAKTPGTHHFAGIAFTTLFKLRRIPAQFFQTLLDLPTELPYSGSKN
jgi:hypothetical protein